MARTGRPPKDPKADQDVKAEIVEWISSGKTLQDFCRQDKKPAPRTIYDWTEKDPEFAAQFARARDLGADAIAEETLSIIDEEPNTVVGDGGSRYDSAHVQWNKNRVELRLKLLAKWNPRRYGDKVTLTGDAENPLQHKHDVNITADEAYKRMLGGG